MIAVLASAIVMGLLGSLHCIGMCGPLMLALPSPDRGNAWAWWKSRLANQLGRILTYTTLGAIVGLVGKSLVTAGFQQWLAIAAGLLMLFFIAWPAGTRKLNAGPVRFVGWIKQKFGILLNHRTGSALFVMGMLNGLLPCGLVYLALSAALATGDVLHASVFMAVFGIGTSPALIAFSRVGNFLRTRLRVRSYKAVQISLAVVAMLVIMRGANLGIPYLSPKVKAQTEEVDCCRKPH